MASVSRRACCRARRVARRLLLAPRRALRCGPVRSLLSLGAALLVGVAVLTRTDLDRPGADPRSSATTAPGGARPPGAAPGPASVTPNAPVDADGPLILYLVANQMEADDLEWRSLLEPLPDRSRLRALVVGTGRADGDTYAGRIIGAVATGELAHDQPMPRVIDLRTPRPSSVDTIAPDLPHMRP